MKQCKTSKHTKLKISKIEYEKKSTKTNPFSLLSSSNINYMCYIYILFIMGDLLLSNERAYFWVWTLFNISFYGVPETCFTYVQVETPFKTTKKKREKLTQHINVVYPPTIDRYTFIQDGSPSLKYSFFFIDKLEI